MTIRVAINGFGRIGRNFARALHGNDQIELVAANDLGDINTLAHLLKHDTVHGRAPFEIKHDDKGIAIDGQYMNMYSDRDPENLPWAELGVDVVIESTGFFTNREGAAKHLSAGAPRVIISAPSGDCDATYVIGVNDQDFDPINDTVISNASCTTNCLAPMVKVLDDAFGLEKGFITTVHAYTGDQSIVDGPHKDLRRARAAAANVVPTSTGAARAIGLVMPHLAGKLDGMAMRVPIPNGSITDFVGTLRADVTADQVNEAFRSAAVSGPLARVLDYSDEPLVSSDIVGTSASCTFDSGLTMAMGDTVKIAGWYDNEWGYSSRLVDLAELVRRRNLVTSDPSGAPKRIGVLTGGGDCPGLNAVIRAVVRQQLRGYGGSVFGFHDGWRGVVENEGEELDVDRLRGTLPRGGTIIGTSRMTPYMIENGPERVRETMAQRNLDALIVIGGEGTLACAARIHDEGIAKVVGVPKTIDNDIPGTERTFGFDTAVSIATDAIDRLHTTAESHDRIMVVEVMGRHVGHIATWAGLAGGATVTLIPEEPFDIEQVCERLARRHSQGKFASIVVVAEGALPAPGTIDITPPEVDRYGHQRLGGIGSVVASEIEGRTGYETRVTVLGHVQRGGTPTAFDRVLCSRFGVAAADAVHHGKFGHMVALNNNEISTVPLADIVGKLNFVPEDMWRTASVFFA